MPLGSGNVELTEAGPVFDGGSDEDRRQLEELHEAVFRANDKLDIDALRKLWSDDPDNVYFNTNGHVYHGIDDWSHIWDHYRPKMHSTQPAPRHNSRIVIRGATLPPHDFQIPLMSLPRSPPVRAAFQ